MSIAVLREKEIIKVAEVAVESITKMPGNKNGVSILVGHRNKSAAIYNLSDDLINKESKIVKLFDGYKTAVKQALYSEIGDKIITAAGPSLFIVDKETKETKEFKGHSRNIITIAMNTENNKIITGSQDCTFILWNTNGEIISKFENIEHGHIGWINCTGFVPESDDNLVTGSEDGTVKIWDLTNGTLLKSFSEGRLVDHKKIQEGTSDVPEYNTDNAVKSMCFSNDGSILAYGGRDGVVNIVNLAHDELLTQVPVPDRITSLISCDSQPLLAIAIPNKVLVYNLIEDKIISEFVFAEKGEVYCYSLIFTGNEIIAGIATGRVLRLEVVRK